MSYQIENEDLPTTRSVRTVYNYELKSKKFKEHKRLFYDENSKVWVKEVECEASGSELSEFSEIEQGCEPTNTPGGAETDWETISWEDSQPKCLSQPEQCN